MQAASGEAGAALVRKATKNDADALVRFNAAMARESEGVELPEARLRAGVLALFEDPSRGQYWVCERDGAIIGQCMVTYEWSDWRNANFWWIQSVYTAPAARRRGVYRALHEEVLRESRRAGACGVRLYVERANTGARAVYEKLGLRAAPYEMMEVDFVLQRKH
jgi:GNAT superfamily N-acetyltransferase